jgi:hypothetical protein
MVFAEENKAFYTGVGKGPMPNPGIKSFGLNAVIVNFLGPCY